MARRRFLDLDQLDRRGLLGEAPSPGVLAMVTLAAVVALGASMFLLGRIERSGAGIALAAIAMAGLAVAVGVALAVMQYRWAEQLDRANEDLGVLHDQLVSERDHHRRVIHDSKAAVAALGAAVHALERRGSAEQIAQAMGQQLSQLRATLDARSVEVEPFHLADVFDGLASFTALHDVELTVRPSPAVVEGDATATLQILQNLVDNSRKYAPASTVRVWAEPAGDQHTLVLVEDDGAGIASGDVDMLFRPGVRAGSGTQGYGMGLAIARQLAEAQGASLWYDESWSGARFVLKMRNGETG